MQAIENVHGREYANELYRQICIYGITGEIETTDQLIIGIIKGMAKPLIDKSNKRYKTCKKNGNKGGRPSKYSTEEIKKLHNQGISNQIIADTLGCSLKTVQRALADVEEDEIQGDDEI